MHELWNKRGVYKESSNNQQNLSYSSEKYDKTPSYHTNSSNETKNSEFYEKPIKVPYDHSHSWPLPNSQSNDQIDRPNEQLPVVSQNTSTFKKSLFSIVNQKRMLAKYKQAVFFDTMNVNRTKQMRINQARGLRSTLIIDNDTASPQKLNVISTSSNESFKIKQNKKVAFAATVKDNLGDFDYEDDHQLDNMDEVFSDIQDPIVEIDHAHNNNEDQN